ncbi:MAG: DUF6056 family protein [Acetobacterium sp.]
MNGLQSKINKIVYWPYFPFAVFAFLMLCLHFGMKPFGDDLVYGEVFSKQPVLTFMWDSYFTWSSRIFIMPVAAFFAAQNFGGFTFFDTCFYFLLPFMVSKLFVFENNWENNWIIVFLLACVPFITMMDTAGWVITSIHYLWPLILGLVALYPLKKIYFEEPIKWYETVFYVMVTIFAANMEVMAVIIMTFYIIFTLYFIYQKRITGFIIFQTVLTMANMVFILTCPGNALREVAETASRFPEYANFGLIEKMALSATSTLICIDQNFILLVVLGMAWIFSWNQYKTLLPRIIGFMPFVFALLINAARVVMLSPKFAYFFNSLTGVNSVDLINPKSLMNVIPGISHYIILSFMVIFAGLLMLMTCVLFKDSKKIGIAVLVMGSGIMARVVMGFSATVYESGARTFLFTYIALAIYGLLLYLEFKPDLSEKRQKILVAALCIIAIMGYLESFLKIF